MKTQFPRASRAQRHLVWRTLFVRQRPRLERAMCPEFLDGLRRSGLDETGAPDHRSLSRKLFDRCGWRIETVPGLIPVADFFALLRERRFPATDWLRHADNLEYTPEPDAFHDLFGHVPQLFVRELTDFADDLAERARGATREELTELERLYWFTIEFGLVRERDRLRAYGAGLASSIDEPSRARLSPEVRRVRLSPELARENGFDPQQEQDMYAVADSLGQLRRCLAPSTSRP